VHVQINRNSQHYGPLHRALTEASRVHHELTREKKKLAVGKAEKKRLFDQLVAGSAQCQSAARNEVGARAHNAGLRCCSLISALTDPHLDATRAELPQLKTDLLLAERQLEAKEAQVETMRALLAKVRLRVGALCHSFCPALIALCRSTDTAFLFILAGSESQRGDAKLHR